MTLAPFAFFVLVFGVGVLIAGAVLGILEALRKGKEDE